VLPHHFLRVAEQFRHVAHGHAGVLKQYPGEGVPEPPRTMAELVDHYGKNELPNKTPCTQEVYTGYITQWITPKWDPSAVLWAP
jgi:hypothetical protein